MLLKNLSYINHRLIPEYWMRSAECGIEGSKTASGITFAENAYIKKGNAVLNPTFRIKDQIANNFLAIDFNI
jgi:hypothetical protein